MSRVMLTEKPGTVDGALFHVRDVATRWQWISEDEADGDRRTMSRCRGCC
jgi:hypothetical protein